MIRLSRLTDYAIVILAELVRARGQVRTVPALAEATGLPGPTAAKVLKALVSAGVVTSHRGAGGGYGLERAPEQVTVAEVIAAIDGPIALTACLTGGEGVCSVELMCPVRSNWDKVNQTILAALSSISLADMLASPWPALPGESGLERGREIGTAAETMPRPLVAEVADGSHCCQARAEVRADG